MSSLEILRFVLSIIEIVLIIICLHLTMQTIGYLTGIIKGLIKHIDKLEEDNDDDKIH